jgi:hypothetical protein
MWHALELLLLLLLTSVAARKRHDLPGWNLVFADEFEGEALDTSKWSVEEGDGCDRGICGWGNDEVSNYHLCLTSCVSLFEWDLL